MEQKKNRHAAPSAARRLTTEALRRVRTFVVWVFPVIAVTTVTRVALAEAYHIPTGSMEPTLQVGDWLAVNKLRFGPHIPFTHVNLPGYAEPRRGDVVVFESPPQHASIRIAPDEITPTLVKRIVGMPGDTLAMRAGHLMVNGVPESRADAPNLTASDAFVEEPLPIFGWQRRFEVTSPSLGAPPRQLTLHQWGPLRVPVGTYFMMGDSRDNSVDSRFYGPVPRANLRGRPAFVYYSFDPDQGVEYVRALTAIRWARLGTWIR